MHCLVWLEKDSKIKTATDIDSIIFAELLCEKHDPVGFEAVSNFMIHGPCGQMNPQSLCMYNDHCSKYYSKKISPQTYIDKSEYALYKRKNNKSSTKRKKKVNLIIDLLYLIIEIYWSNTKHI